VLEQLVRRRLQRVQREGCQAIQHEISIVGVFGDARTLTLAVIPAATGYTRSVHPDRLARGNHAESRPFPIRLVEALA